MEKVVSRIKRDKRAVAARASLRGEMVVEGETVEVSNLARREALSCRVRIDWLRARLNELVEWKLRFYLVTLHFCPDGGAKLRWVVEAKLDALYEYEATLLEGACVCVEVFCLLIV